jgi:hypothetical protein
LPAQLTDIVSNLNSNGSMEGLSIDANGDLFGTTADLLGGPTPGTGTVFEIQNLGTLAAPNYASVFNTLVSFSGGQVPTGALTIDASGNLFGTTINAADIGATNLGAASNHGTVFEIKNTGTVAVPNYTSAPITLVNFLGADGADPEGGLTIDANGDLFGTTQLGGTNNDGTAFEIKNSGTVAASNYASVPTTLVNFNGSNGSSPFGRLIIDAQGDLLGTTNSGGASGDGTVFEIKNTGTLAAPNYASAPTTLISFDGTDGSVPVPG